MKCQICNEKCKGNIIIRDISIKEELVVCSSCLNDYGNQDYDKLIQKLERKDEKLKNERS